MFAQVFADFDDRVSETDLYFQALAALDNDEIAIVPGTAGQVLAVGAPPADWGRMLKGAAYLVLYNLVEAFIRRGFQAVFDTIRGEGLCGADLVDLVREQWITQRNRTVAPFDGSPKVYMAIANGIVKDIIDKKAVHMVHARLPISGNMDADVIRAVCQGHGIDHTVPAAAKGGTALSTVKAKRNALSHGDESFVEVGRMLVAADLIKAKDEIVIFVRSILQNLQQYAVNKTYRV